MNETAKHEVSLAKTVSDNRTMAATDEDLETKMKEKWRQL
jgi:hypothetical protein